VSAPSGPPYEAYPPDAPATVEDVRATRRWTWVAFAWAIAASVIAVLALIQASGDNSNDTTTSTQSSDVAGQLQSFQKQTNDRLDQFSRRLNNAASAGDVAKLDRRLSKVEDGLTKLDSTSSDQANTIKQIQSDVQDLQKRVAKLEQQQQQSGTTTGTTTTP
jgi:septal ring factor EnvC (AmiA/AmiB activator)